MNTKGNPGIGGAPFQRVTTLANQQANSVFGIANKHRHPLSKLVPLSTRWDIEPSAWGELMTQAKLGIFPLAPKQTKQTTPEARQTNQELVRIYAPWRSQQPPFITQATRWIVQLM